MKTKSALLFSHTVYFYHSSLCFIVTPSPSLPVLTITIFSSKFHVFFLFITHPHLDDRHHYTHVCRAIPWRIPVNLPGSDAWKNWSSFPQAANNLEWALGAPFPSVLGWQAWISCRIWCRQPQLLTVSYEYGARACFKDTVSQQSSPVSGS